MNKIPPAVLAQRAALGAVDDFVSAWITQGFSAWLQAGCSIPLQQCLRLSPSPGHAKKAIRDAWLVEAGKLIDTTTSEWGRAVTLKQSAERFERRQWPRWKGARMPPAYASEFDGILFFALKYGANLPTTVRQYHRILARHETPDKCHGADDILNSSTF